MSHAFLAELNRFGCFVFTTAPYRGTGTFVVFAVDYFDCLESVVESRYQGGTWYHQVSKLR